MKINPIRAQQEDITQELYLYYALEYVPLVKPWSIESFRLANRMCKSSLPALNLLWRFGQSPLKTRMRHSRNSHKQICNSHNPLHVLVEIWLSGVLALDPKMSEATIKQKKQKMEETNSRPSNAIKANQPKGPSGTYKPPKSRGGGPNPQGKGENSNTKPSKPRPPRTNHNNAPPRVKIIIRKLPATRDYTQEDFQKALESVMSALNFEKSVCNLEHFIPGKMRQAKLTSNSLQTKINLSTSIVFVLVASAAP